MVCTQIYAEGSRPRLIIGKDEMPLNKVGKPNILLLENEMQRELKDALMLGIYDVIFDPFEIKEIQEKISIPATFSNISKYIKNLLELGINN